MLLKSNHRVTGDGGEERSTKQRMVKIFFDSDKFRNWYTTNFFWIRLLFNTIKDAN